jgi:KUP system potassium uptake protein
VGDRIQVPRRDDARDNNGEGGILALLALALRNIRHQPRVRWVVIGIGIFGASMFYGDSMITPAITVLGAVEGLEVQRTSSSPTSFRSPS